MLGLPDITAWAGLTQIAGFNKGDIAGMMQGANVGKTLVQP